MATLTLKNVPEELIARLKREAAANRRSMNQEAIAQLERQGTVSPDDLARIEAEVDEFRAELAARGFQAKPADVVAAIRRGRP